MNAGTIVFDLDGTLIDTAPDLVATLNFIFAAEGLVPVDYEKARNLVGGGARAMIERGLAAEHRACTPEALDRLVGHFVQHYAGHIADHSRPFPDLEDTLDILTAAGWRLAVCTNKLEWLALRLLDAVGLRGRFAVVCGGDTFAVQKPHPDLLRRTIRLAGGTIGRAVMVGDSLTDIAMARSAAVPVIAVDYGYSETPVTNFAPDRVIGSLAELPSAALDLLQSRDVAGLRNA